MPVKNVVAKTKAMIGKVNPHYDMTDANIREIYETYPNQPLDLICCSFKFGYIQGMKAARSKMEKRGGEMNA